MKAALMTAMAFVFLTGMGNKPDSEQVQFEPLGPALGSPAPDFKAKTADGKPFKLSDALAQSPVLLVFYRGGWCPFCMRQLKELQSEILPLAKSKQVQILALSVDPVHKAAETLVKHGLELNLLSDSHTRVIKKYRLVERISSPSVPLIAVPAVFLLDQQGKVLYRFADRNYRRRAPLMEIKVAIEALP